MERRLSGILFLLLMLVMPFLLLGGGAGELRLAASTRPTPLQAIEETLTRRFPASEFLRRLQISLKYAGGTQEQNGVFISNDTLLADVQPKDQATVNRNTLAMIDFAEKFQRPSYVMLIPTACAVQQSKVPYAYDALLYNQKQLIDDVYHRVSGHVTAINVYPVLRNHQAEYIYYRTENSATGLGGYYIYSIAAQRLNIKPRGIEQFEVEHLDYSYYGSLYRLAPYREITPDRVSVYRYAKSEYSYTVTHLDTKGVRRYFTLYPKFRAQLGNTTDVILGGTSPIIDITSNNIPKTSPNGRQLLIFGDRSVQSYLPFLLTHYTHVTVVDTASVTPALLQGIDVASYSQVLFAYSVDSYIGAEQLGMLSKLTPIP